MTSRSAWSGKGGVVEKSAFLSLVEEKDAAGHYRYPHDLDLGRSAPGATSVLRKTLAAQPDHSVVIAQVGFSTNLARLLDSPPDEHSPLSGLELVRRKVKLLSLMAGAFQPIEGNQPLPGIQRRQGRQECPDRSPSAGRRPMVYSGFEIGIALPYPAISIERDYAYVPASSAGRGLHPPQPAAAQPADLGPDQRALRGPRRSRLFRPLAAREGDRRTRRLHAVRGDDRIGITLT